MKNLSKLLEESFINEAKPWLMDKEFAHEIIDNVYNILVDMCKAVEKYNVPSIEINTKHIYKVDGEYQTDKDIVEVPYKEIKPFVQKAMNIMLKQLEKDRKDEKNGKFDVRQRVSGRNVVWYEDVLCPKDPAKKWKAEYLMFYDVNEMDPIDLVEEYRDMMEKRGTPNNAGDDIDNIIDNIFIDVANKNPNLSSRTLSNGAKISVNDSKKFKDWMPHLWWWYMLREPHILYIP